MRIGFFGQISALKGADVMFDAAASWPLIKSLESASKFSVITVGNHRNFRPPSLKDWQLRVRICDFTGRMTGRV